MPFPVDPKFIDQAEAKLGTSFPMEYRKRMSALNGGEIQTGEDHWQLYPFFDTSDKKRLKRTANDIVRETASARGWAEFPGDAVAVASNGFGDLAILVPVEHGSRDLQDVVFRWNHETGEVVILSPTTAIWFNKRGQN